MFRKKFPLITIIVVVFSTYLYAETIYPDSLKVVRGEISDQDISVLSYLEQEEEENDWNTYLEQSSLNNKSVVKFFFNTSTEQRTCQTATLKLNTLGEARVREKWNFYIKNFVTNKFEKIMNNSEKDWIWSYQERDINTLSKYIDSKGKIQFKSSCKNCTVMDIDYLALTLNNCETTTPPPDTNNTAQLDLNSTYNLQYTNTSNIITSGFDIIDIDMEDTSATQIATFKNVGKKVVCYISAGSYENWREDVDSFPSEVLGNDMDGWEGEKWLDISNIDALEPIMAARMDRAKAKGCDMIHPDNIDGYTNNTGFTLNYGDQIDYNRILATLAHDRGMLIALKNDVDQIAELVNDFDFVINESCYTYNECSDYSYFIEANKPVFIIEYSENVFLENGIDASENGFYMIHKNRNLNDFVQVN